MKSKKITIKGLESFEFSRIFYRLFLLTDHITTVTVNRVDIVVSRNFKHIVNLERFEALKINKKV